MLRIFRTAPARTAFRMRSSWTSPTSLTACIVLPQRTRTMRGRCADKKSHEIIRVRRHGASAWNSTTVNPDGDLSVCSFNDRGFRLGDLVVVLCAK